MVAAELARCRQELQEATRELEQAQEQQTATAEILKMISSSPTDLQPVFEAILEKAIRLCDAHMGYLGLYDGEKYQYVAQRGTSANYARFLSERGRYRPRGPLARMVAERQPVHLADARDSPYYRDGVPNVVAMVELGAVRTFLAAPMLKEGRVVGGISIYRPEARPFTQKQIDLVSTFANQAVIAIENVRLFKELQTRNAEVTEALEQQTVTADILKVISSSPTDVQPVFDAIVKSGVHLFGGMNVSLRLLQGNHTRVVASTIPLVDVDDGFLLPLDDDEICPSRSIGRREVVQFPDVLAPDISERARDRARRRGFCAIVSAPLLRESIAIGAISVSRATPGTFTDKQVALLQTLADQAVIAIENVRLFREIQDKSRQLEIANKHKSEFLANMSHELRTPLNSVIGFSDLLLERLYGELNARQENYIRNIQASGKHLLSLINDILDLSKIEAGRMELDVARVHIPSALQNAMMLMRERAQRQNIALSCDLDPAIGDMQADERKFKQIMLNLLSNAVKFTPQGGRVDVEARLLNGHLEVSVRDNGVGIASEHQQAVFEKFRRVGRQESGRQEGTGLGLALSRRFVELHGGTIRLESEPGKGSTFTVTLPLKRQA